MLIYERDEEELGGGRRLQLDSDFLRGEPPLRESDRAFCDIINRGGGTPKRRESRLRAESRCREVKRGRSSS